MILKLLKTKLQALVLVSLLTLLAVSGSAIHSKNERIESLERYEQLYEQEVDRVDELQEQNDDLHIQLRDKSEALPTITKDVYENICKGEVEEQRILSAPATKQKQVGPSNEKPYVDIDAPFDPDFLRLLDE